MKKSLLFMVVASAWVIVSCGGAEQVKTDQAEGFGSDKIVVSQMNKQLEKAAFEGFAYKSSDVPSNKYDKWAASAAPVIKGILEKMPKKYLLQIGGHTDNKGPENSEAGKAGNIKLSEKRAKAVYDALVRKGVKSPKMTYKGFGSSQLKSELPGDDSAQRRVTFQVVPE